MATQTLEGGRPPFGSGSRSRVRPLASSRPESIAQRARCTINAMNCVFEGALCFGRPGPLAPATPWSRDGRTGQDRETPSLPARLMLGCGHILHSTDRVVGGLSGCPSVQGASSRGRGAIGGALGLGPRRDADAWAMEVVKGARIKLVSRFPSCKYSTHGRRGA